MGVMRGSEQLEDAQQAALASAHCVGEPGDHAAGRRQQIPQRRQSLPQGIEDDVHAPVADHLADLGHVVLRAVVDGVRAAELQVVVLQADAVPNETTSGTAQLEDRRRLPAAMCTSTLWPGCTVPTWKSMWWAVR